MLISMTGFGSKIVHLSLKKEDKASLNIEIRALNSRFFELTSKLPVALNFLEAEIFSILKQKSGWERSTV